MCPSVSSDLRLVVSYLMEYTEDWANEYAYIKPERFRSITSESMAQPTNLDKNGVITMFKSRTNLEMAPKYRPQNF